MYPLTPVGFWREDLFKVRDFAEAPFGAAGTIYSRVELGVSPSRSKIFCRNSLLQTKIMASIDSATSDKYPSTPHLSFSPGLGDGDTKLAGAAGPLFDEEVILTEKLDGGNCCIARGQVYARTHKHEAKHPWFGTIKSMHNVLAATRDDPTLELFGENMTATHSIEYNNLTGYFYLFGVRREGVWASWDEIEATASSLGLPTVPLRFRGVVRDLETLQELIRRFMVQNSSVSAGTGPEGFVLRVTRAFEGKQFEHCVAKYVRENHVQTGDDFSRIWPRNKARLGEALPDCPAEEA